ncbi:ABC transporter ATP-binding protein [Flammeovirga kamogawensis]|uniref:ATP-binding cassette domain-containing protein n=1 Tax=Flammeovirga kamogawensis TaxID=373891 RepID=A0ABX8GYP4_9BACT|nr:ATP-binding cassette domain-containing protein [Flammeovirga kamogawensis]MBB6459097.1 ABC-2 type transport system ATP-binding protein [Flammeovirga kamogawensis]QWG08666.1 ATP-binding cassette domain-containing protein [Flammeovirga kamogawensis]TRX66959.1 ABC transporter ATP-binding protein [Flammeovirga kamogawensis]
MQYFLDKIKETEKLNILEVKGITKRYANHTALNNVSLSVPEQCIYGLLGPNGAGKTSLIRSITQIITPEEGEIFFNGKPLSPEDVYAMGYLPEERGLYKKMGVAEQILYLAQLKGLSSKEAKERTKFWLDRLELKPWYKSNVEDLSKGMQQKVQFISTVIHEPKLLILDEPFSGFDPVNAQLIRDEIFRLRDLGATIILSTHRMESVEQLCDRIALINQSQKVLEGTQYDIKSAYRNNQFDLTTTTPVTITQTPHELVTASEKVMYGYKQTIRLHSASPNDLLKEATEKSTVIGMQENIPNMHDIFIEAVQNGNVKTVEEKVNE